MWLNQCSVSSIVGSCPSHLRKRDYELVFPRPQVHPPYPVPLGGGLALVRVRNAHISVPRPRAGDPGEVQGEGVAPVRAEGVDGEGKGAGPSGADIEDPGHEPSSLPVVVDYLLRGRGHPLEHAALLPAPGLGLGYGVPPGPFLQVYESYDNFVLGGGRTVHESYLHPKHVPSGGVPGGLVVVPEEVVLRARGHGPHTERVQGEI